MATLPQASTATAFALSSPVPPAVRAQRYAPWTLYLTTKMAERPGLVTVPPPKFAGYWKYPAMTMSPLGATTTPAPASSAEPPMNLTHWQAPDAPLNRARNASRLLDVVDIIPHPRFTRPAIWPVTTTSPFQIAAMP